MRARDGRGRARVSVWEGETGDLFRASTELLCGERNRGMGICSMAVLVQKRHRFGTTEALPERPQPLLERSRLGRLRFDTASRHLAREGDPSPPADVVLSGM